MTLSISSYSGLQKLPCVRADDGEPCDPSTGAPYLNYFDAYVHPQPEWAGRAGQIQTGDVFTYVERIAGPSISYGGYTHWRESLAWLAGYPAVLREDVRPPQLSYAEGAWLSAGGPFHELIHFSDCEGTLGAAVCAKLARDFAEFDGKARAFLCDQSGNSPFYAVYRLFRKAFEHASDGGAVEFH